MSGNNAKLQLLSIALVATTFAPNMVQAQGQSADPKQDPIAIYKATGINAEQEGKIRSLAKQFEDAQKVRSQLIINLLGDMRTLQFKTDPPEKAVLAKQNEINNLQAEMANERIKLMIKIRNVLNGEQKQRLVDLMKRHDQIGGKPNGAR